MVIVLSPSAANSFGRGVNPTCSVPPEDSRFLVEVPGSQNSSEERTSESTRASLRKLLRGLLHRRKKHREAKQVVEPSQAVSRPSMTLLEQSIATMRTSSIRSLGKSFRKSSHVDMLDETWEDWLEQYQTGTKNLSTLSRPVCFCGFGHMAPPHHKNEIARLQCVDKVSDRRLWRQEREWLHGKLRPLLLRYRLKAATVSLIEKTCQVVMQDVGLGRRFTAIGRELSLDAHAILSSEYFTLLDAGTDWRTRLNPLVHGPPFIKFYIGIPIFIYEQPVGCLAMFDPYLKAQVPQQLVSELTAISQELGTRIQSRADEQRNPKGKVRFQWPEEDGKDVASMVTVASSASESTDTSVPSLDLRAGCLASEAEMTFYDSRVFPLLGPQACRTILQPYEVFESLLRCRSIPQAIKKACRIVWQNLGSELVYVVEVRSRRDVLVPAPSLRGLKSGALLSSVGKFEDIAEPAYTPCARIVGFYGPELGFDAKSEIMRGKSVYRTTIASKYGIKVSAREDSSSALQSCMLMPFRRKPERLTWNTGAPAAGSVTCSVWTSGYVMGAAVSHAREFSPGDVVFMKKVVRAVENILTCREEQDGNCVN